MEAIRELKLRGIQQTDIAKRLGCQSQFLSALKSGDRNLSAGFAKRLERAVGINAHWLLSGEGDPWKP
ncbi:MAG: helix-turn-helix transcriptional regulator, partial [Planctomycetes bacterium]|nr:helix-turn-helix transcriptional regulator [Planctomycetota bacterium]